MKKRFILLLIIFSLPLSTSAITITKTGSIYSQNTASYDWSPDNIHWYFIGGASDTFCLNTCSGNPPWDLSPQMDPYGSTGYTSYIRTPNGGGTDKCSFLVSGSTGSWDYAQGNTISGTCTYTGDFIEEEPPETSTSSDEYLQECYNTNGTSTCALIQVGGNITLILLIFLVLALYLIIEHLYYRLFPSKMRIKKTI